MSSQASSSSRNMQITGNFITGHCKWSDAMPRDCHSGQMKQVNLEVRYTAES